MSKRADPMLRANGYGAEAAADSPAAAGSQPEPTEHLERFDPDGQGGKLIESEHRGRYWWAASIAEGNDILDAGCGVGYGLEILADAGAASLTGVDIDEGTIATARSRFPSLAESFYRGDLCRLPMADDSFDVVVCFETIQHVQDGERALGELCRVLRPDGLLLISSPSPDVYPPGNEHHVHEYRPTDLSAVLEERFDNVAGYRQHPWLASAIEPSISVNGPSRRREVRTASDLEPGAETYSILAASDDRLPALESLVALGVDFEVRWWADRVAEAEEREHQARARMEEAERDASRRVAAAESLLAERENELLRTLAGAEAREASVQERLQRTAVALLEANQSLAQLPSIRYRHDEFERLEAHVEMLEGSRSWRYMAPLRRIRNFFRRRTPA
jgi:ubiquinone/menaquinone biosynthesis C-methylase UbiE